SLKGLYGLALENRGIKLTPEEINILKPSRLKNALERISTGEQISKEGFLTNISNRIKKSVSKKIQQKLIRRNLLELALKEKYNFFNIPSNASILKQFSEKQILAILRTGETSKAKKLFTKLKDDISKLGKFIKSKVKTLKKVK